MDSPADPANQGVVLLPMVGSSDDFRGRIGADGVLGAARRGAALLIDSTTIFQAASDDVRAFAAERAPSVLPHRSRATPRWSPPGG